MTEIDPPLDALFTNGDVILLIHFRGPVGYGNKNILPGFFTGFYGRGFTELYRVFLSHFAAAP